MLELRAQSTGNNHALYWASSIARALLSAKLDAPRLEGVTGFAGDPREQQV